MQGYNFTYRVRIALGAAREEASRFGNDEVATQHILFALLRQSPSVAVSAIESFGVRLDQVARRLEETVKREPEAHEVRTDLPYSSPAKKVLELAMAEALGLNHSYVGTHHLLLGLVREEKGVAAQVLTLFGISIDAARTHVLEILSSGKQDDDGLHRRAATAVEIPRKNESSPGETVAFVVANEVPAHVTFPIAPKHTGWMAASIIETLLQDANIADVFAAQGIDVRMLTAALRSAALRPPPGHAPGSSPGDSATPSPPAA
jgi:hypothetical protein